MRLLTSLLDSRSAWSSRKSLKFFVYSLIKSGYKDINEVSKAFEGLRALTTDYDAYHESSDTSGNVSIVSAFGSPGAA